MASFAHIRCRRTGVVQLGGAYLVMLFETGISMVRTATIAAPAKGTVQRRMTRASSIPAVRASD
jgi:hypothetical protein